MEQQVKICPCPSGLPELSPGSCTCAPVTYSTRIAWVTIALTLLLCGCAKEVGVNPLVAIQGDKFFLNGEPLYKGRLYRGHSLEGLLLNARMVQAIFDDLNPDTRELWRYPDTGTWDANRNTREFIHAMSDWKAHGLAAISLNLQGGSPTGYGNKDWINSAFASNGDRRPAYFDRLKSVMDEARRLEMIVILGLFYFGQDQHLRDEAAVINAVDQAIAWLHQHQYRHVVIEISNESNLTPSLITSYFNSEIGKLAAVAGSKESIDNMRQQLERIDTMSYQHEILSDSRVHELILRVQKQSHNGYRYLASTSFAGSTLPTGAIVNASDFVLLHGNNTGSAERIHAMVEQIKTLPAYRGQPIVFNEDDHYDYQSDKNHFLTAIKSGAGWGYFDYRREGEDFREGYQSVPVDWSISSQRKNEFFDYLHLVTSGTNP